MAEITNYTNLVRNAEEAAKRERKRDLLASLPGYPSWAPASAIDTVGELARDVVIPQTPLDVGLAIATAPVPWLRAPARIGAATLGALLDPDEAQAANIVRGVRRFVTPAGFAREGGDYTKRAREIMDQLASEQKGAGPVDLARQSEIPDVPQFALERYRPKHGITDRLQDALTNPDVLKGVADSIERGKAMGADKWYYTGPLRDAFVSEFGEREGGQRLKMFMDQVAATSPRSDISTNIRNASYYYLNALKGRSSLPEELPYPYGHVAQNLHRQNYEGLITPPRGLSAEATPTAGWDLFKNPKPPSFSQNLQGNLIPGTIDTHAFRNIAMRTGDPRFLETSISNLYKPGKSAAEDTLVARYGEVSKGKEPGELKVTYRPQQLYKEGKLTLQDAPPIFWASKPRKNEYGAAELFYADQAQRAGLPTAAGQSAAWSGAGELTGLASPPTMTFNEMLNHRVMFTARMRGENPQDTLRYFMRGQKPLLTGAGAVPLAAGAMRGGPTEAAPAEY